LIFGLIGKTIREVWLSTLLFALGLGAIEGMLASLLPTIYRQLPDQWLQIKFVQNMLKALLGTEVGSSVGPGVIAAIAWAHPIVLALVCAHTISFCTRVPAGEVDRGTIDVLLGLPISRTGVYLSESAVWLASGLAVIVTGLVGNFVGRWIYGSEQTGDSAQLVMVTANLYCLYIAVGGFTCLVSSMSDRRGWAVAVVFAVVLASFLLNFIAQFWIPAKSVSFLSVLSYYRPMFILRDSTWPVTDMVVLLGVGSILWGLGAIVFARRDICAA